MKAKAVSLNIFLIFGAWMSSAFGVNFDGIVTSGCSGAIVRYESSKDDDPALVLTAGHCSGPLYIDPGKYVLDSKAHAQFTVLKPTNGKPVGYVYANRLLYATMTGTDLAIFQVGDTFREIEERFQVHPLTLSREVAPSGTKIEVISGTWRRGFACSIDYLVDTLKESGWIWRDSIRYKQPGCEISPGTSGSPVLVSGTRTVVGVNNTLNTGYSAACSEGNPCEVDRDGRIKSEKGAAYAQQIALIYSCLDSRLNFDLRLSTCRLTGGPLANSP